MRQEKMTVTATRAIADHVLEMKLSGVLAEDVREPGQFVHIRPNLEPSGSLTLLRRPISICAVDQETDELTLIFRHTGAGTAQIASKIQGERLDVLGPLGHGFPVDAVPSGGSAVLIGGGVGVPPLYGLSQALVARGISVTHVLGFRSAKDVFYTDEFSALGNTVVFTEDGSLGRQGLVTEALGEVAFDVAYACGPLPMLRALQTKITGKPLYLSLEQRMGCGVGACLACVVHTVDANDSKGYRRVCCDGPVFPSGEVEL
ncbi:MAG: dihydroorotate dehydrogenase electron transfer subunit [Sporolactobacillus sp.]